MLHSSPVDPWRARTAGVGRGEGLQGVGGTRTIRTPEKGERLLGKFRLGFSVAAACRAEKIGRQTYYDWRKADNAFAAAADDAIDEGTDYLEDKARDRAIKESDTLMIFLLKGRRPEKYRDRFDAQISGPGGGPLLITELAVTRTSHAEAS